MPPTTPPAIAPTFVLIGSGLDVGELDADAGAGMGLVAVRDCAEKVVCRYNARSVASQPFAGAVAVACPSVLDGVSD